MNPVPRPPKREKKQRKPVKKVNRKRKSANWVRSYGSEARVEWVKRQPCIVCGSTPSENAHSENGGTSRKANAETIVPLCRKHHFILHCEGKSTFEEAYKTHLSWSAEYTEECWRRSGGSEK